MKSISDIKTDPRSYFAPLYIVNMCTKLLNHEEMAYIENSEVRIISKHGEDIRRQLQESLVYQKYLKRKDVVTLMDSRPMIKSVPMETFISNLEANIPEELKDDKEQYIGDKILYRYMEGTCVCKKGDDNICLLCDDSRSLMKQLYDTRIKGACVSLLHKKMILRYVKCER